MSEKSQSSEPKYNSKPQNKQLHQFYQFQLGHADYGVIF